MYKRYNNINKVRKIAAVNHELDKEGMFLV